MDHESEAAKGLFCNFAPDVNERIYNECSECVFPHLSIPNWFTSSHSSKGEIVVEIAEKMRSGLYVE